MSRWAGDIGFMETDPTRRGVHQETIVTRHYRGEVLRDYSSNFQTVAGQVNPNLKVSAVISITADPYINYHFSTIRWVEYMNVKWCVSRVAPQYPRINLTLGDVYLEQTDPEEDDYG